jgi:hypothetical protein
MMENDGMVEGWNTGIMGTIGGELFPHPPILMVS